MIETSALQRGAPADVDRVTREIVAACENAGFFYVVGHGVPGPLIDAIFEAARWFFARAQAERDAARRCDLAEFSRLCANRHHPRAERAAPFARSLPDDARPRARRSGRPRRQHHARGQSLAAGRARLSGGDGRLLCRHDGARPPFARRLRAGPWIGGRESRAILSQASDPIAPAALSAATARCERPGRRGARTPTPARSPSCSRIGSAGWRCGDQSRAVESKRRRSRAIYVVNIGDMMQRWTGGRYVSTPHASPTDRRWIASPRRSSPTPITTRSWRSRLNAAADCREAGIRALWRGNIPDNMAARGRRLGLLLCLYRVARSLALR